jgi:hypothetical protein
MNLHTTEVLPGILVLTRTQTLSIYTVSKQGEAQILLSNLEIFRVPSGFIWSSLNPFFVLGNRKEILALITFRDLPLSIKQPYSSTLNLDLP